MLTSIKKHIPPILFTSSMIVSVLSIYTPWIPLVAVFITVLCAGMFAFCDLVAGNKRIRVICNALVISFSLLFIFLFVLSNFMTGGDTWKNFSGFFALEDLSPAGFSSLILFLCILLSAFVYYIAVVRFRLSILFLILFLPPLMYSHQTASMPVLYIAMNISLFFAVAAAGNGQEKDTLRLNLRGHRYGLTVFTAAVFVCCLFLPSLSDITWAGQQQQQQGLLPGLPGGTEPASRYGYFHRTSNPQTGTVPSGDRLLFTVRADEPLYLRGQVFGDYTNGNWEYAINGAEAAAFHWNNSLPAGGSYKQAVISMQNFTPRILYHPIGTFSILNLLSVYQTEWEELYVDEGAIAANETYSLLYDPEYIRSSAYWGSEEGRMEDWEAMQYRDRCRSEMSSELIWLAVELTARCPSDYEKALVLQQYFIDEGFVYDLDFVPEQPGTDNFLFQDKRGICGDFATAMTLMCRAAGLPARYVEGFLAHQADPNDPDLYLVREHNAHAYTEVFIEGRGWTVFDATVPGNAPGAGLFPLLQNQDIMALSLGGALLSVVLFRLFNLFALPPVRERLFRTGTLKSNPQTGIIQIFLRVQKKIGILEQTDTSVYSPQMLAELVKRRTSYDLLPLAVLYDKAVFGPEPAARQDLERAYAQYIQWAGALKRFQKDWRGKKRRPTKQKGE